MALRSEKVQREQYRAADDDKRADERAPETATRYRSRQTASDVVTRVTRVERIWRAEIVAAHL
jgi:hypothetical protein